MAVDVGSAVGYLDLDISGFLTGLKSAQSEANVASKNMAAKIGGAMQSVGGGMAKVGGFVTAGITTPIATAVTASVKQFANLEQSIGGVETLFKGSAQTVISSAETAYKRAGIDANNYMEQVTSFSATLLQSLGGDTKKAADYADKAIVDMSDNANKMGTDIGRIQDAYQGFAKQNYTMLDNLKLGYGGTKTEMERLIADANKVKKANGEMGDLSIKSFSDIVEAIHTMQTELGITGTTAKEAEGTVSGSFGMMKSSVLNFLQQLGNPGADMKKFSQEMIDSVKIFVGNVKRVLVTIWDNLPISPLQKKLLVAAAAFGPVMLAGGKVVSTVGSIVTGVNKAIPLINQFSAGFASAGTKLASDASLMTSFGAAVGASIGPILAVVAIIAVLVAAFKHLWETNKEFRDKITGVWDGIKSKFESFAQGIVDRLNALGFDFESFGETVKAIWNGFCSLLAPIFEGVFNQISVILSSVLDALTGIFDVFIGIFTGNWNQAWQGVKEIFGAVWNLIEGTFKSWVTAFEGIANTVLGWFGTTWNETWTSIKQFFVDVWNGIVSFFSSAANSIKTTASDFVTAIVSFFSNLPYKVGYFIGNTLANIIVWADDMVTKAREMGTNFLNAVISFFIQLPGKVLQFITSAFNNVQIWAVNMPNKAREMGANFINNVVSFMQQLPGKIKQYLDSTINNLKIWVIQMGQKGKEAVTELINNVMSAASGIANKVMSIGTDIVKGVWNGIKNAAGWFRSQVEDFFSGIVDGVKDTLGIGSPSKVFRDEIGRWLPPGVVQGFEAAMPSAMKAIQKDLNKGIDNIDTDDISVSAGITVSGFADKLKSIYNEVALWFESIENRIGNSVDSMMQSLDMLIRAGQVIVNSDGTLGYIGYNGFTKPGNSEGYVDRTNPKDKNAGGNGDTFIFNSPKAIDEIEAAKQMKKTKQDMAEGF